MNATCYNSQLFVFKMTLKRRRKSRLQESYERSTMERGIPSNVKKQKKLNKLSYYSLQLVSSPILQPLCPSSLLASLSTSTSSQFVKRKTRGIFSTTWILFLMVLNFVSSSSSSSSSKTNYVYSYFIIRILYMSFILLYDKRS